MWRYLTIQTVLALIVVPSIASAQVWLEGRETREGTGIKLGDSLILHPGAAVEGGYDSNPLREEPDAAGAARLRLTGHIDIATRKKERRAEDDEVEDSSPPKMDFRFGLAGFYDFYFSSNEVVDSQDDFGIDSHASFVLFPEGKASFLANASYIRTLQPYESSEEWHAHHYIGPRLGLRVRPGGGTLAIGLSYGASFLLYEDNVVAETNNKIRQDVTLDTSWKVFPKTALVSNVRFSPINYLGDIDENNNSKPLRATAGIRGLLTSKLGLNLMVGYGVSFYDEGDDYEGVIANGEMMFFPTPFSNIRVGGQRDFVDSFYANYYSKTGGYLKFEQMFGSVFLVSLRGDAYYRDYSTMVAGLQSSDRKDVWVTGRLLLEFRATNWLSVMATAEYQQNFSSFIYEREGGLEDPVEFQRFEVMGGLRAHY